MNKVYVVTSGEYSDYRIRGIFTTEEAANQYAAAVHGSVEEWDVDTINLKVGYLYYRVYMGLHTGETYEIHQTEYQDSEMEDTITKYCKREGGEAFYDWLSRVEASPERVYFAHVWALSEIHAVKIANERRTYYLATSEIATPSQTHLRQ